MTRPRYHLWTHKAGIHDLLSEEITSTVIRKTTPDDKKRWMDIISAHAPCTLKELVQSFNLAYTKIEEKTPVALFFSHPQLFYELFWPYARERVGREYYILQFERPLMVKLNFVYELSILPNDQLEQPMIYLGCLSDRVPILTASINDIRESIVPYEALVSAVTTVLEKSSDCVLIKTQLRIEEIELERLVRYVLTISKPQFIEFNLEKYTSEKLVIVSMTATGSLLEDKNSETGDQQRKIWTKIKRAISFLRHSIVLVLRSFLGIPLREPSVHLQIYPKSSLATLWTYVYAPEKYHLRACSVSSRCKDNILENNSPKNPDLLSYSLRRKEPTQVLYPIDFHFTIQIPKMDYIWLNTIDKLLLIFSIIWLSACLKFLPLCHEFSTITEKAFSVVTYPGLLGSTFVLIGFILLARSWLLHESTVYKAVSIRFAVLLISLTILCLVFVFLCIV